jgi:hypothetical protein
MSFLSIDICEAINPVVKLDVATSCDNLSIVDKSSHQQDLIENFEVMSLENEKLKKYLKDATTKGNVVIERNDLDNELVHAMKCFECRKRGTFCSQQQSHTTDSFA